MSEHVLTWPSHDPAYGDVRLRAFEDRDAEMVMDMATDSLIPLIGTLPADATRQQALDYIERQRGRLGEGAGYSFCIADRCDDRALGGVGLWLAPIEHGRATAGYGVAPSARGRRVAGQALTALVQFAWTLPPVHRIELYIEPWNVAPLRTAQLAGFVREGLLRSHQEVGGRRVDMLLYAVIRP